MELHSLIIYLLITINLSYFVGSNEKDMNSSRFIRSNIGKRLFVTTIFIGIGMFFFIPIIYSWWYFLIEILIFLFMISLRNQFISRPFLFGPLLTMIYLVNFMIYILNWFS